VSKTVSRLMLIESRPALARGFATPAPQSELRPRSENRPRNLLNGC